MAKEIINIVLQVDESQHLSTERVIINYLDTNSKAPDKILVKVLPYEDLSAAGTAKYTDFKDFMNALINTN